MRWRLPVSSVVSERRPVRALLLSCSRLIQDSYAYGPYGRNVTVMLLTKSAVPQLWFFTDEKIGRSHTGNFATDSNLDKLHNFGQRPKDARSIALDTLVLSDLSVLSSNLRLVWDIFYMQNKILPLRSFQSQSVQASIREGCARYAGYDPPWSPVQLRDTATAQVFATRLTRNWINYDKLDEDHNLGKAPKQSKTSIYLKCFWNSKD